MGFDFPMYSLGVRAGRWSFNETMQQIKEVWDALTLAHPNASLSLGIENIQYQQVAIEEVQRRYKLPAVGLPQLKDKRAKFETISPYFEQGQILLREEGDEDLEMEILGFGIEPHDDRADAFELAMRQLVSQERLEVVWL